MTIASAATDYTKDKLLVEEPAALKPQVAKLYKERWWILSSVCLIQFANFGHWIAFGSVTKVTAVYYDQPGDRMDLVVLCSYVIYIPTLLIAAVWVNRFGIKKTLHLSGFLTAIGSLMCCLSSFPYLAKGMYKDNKFYLALTGQLVGGVGRALSTCVPTKVSQAWFGESQRMFATGVMVNMGTLGRIISLGLTPVIVGEQSHRVPYMNIAWLIPALIGQALTVFKVKADTPPTPPSTSAKMDCEDKMAFKSTVQGFKQLITIPFATSSIAVGILIGMAGVITTKMEQMMCASGYSDQFTGLVTSLFLACGTFACFPITLALGKISARRDNGHHVSNKKLSWLGNNPTLTYTKASMTIGLGSMIAFLLFVQTPDQKVGLLTMALISGVAFVPIFPLALELITETTYPVNQTISTPLVMIMPSLFGSIMIGAELGFDSGVSTSNSHGGINGTSFRQHIQTCSEEGDSAHEVAKDYSTYIYFLIGWVVALWAIYVCGFFPKMKRSNADKSNELRNKEDN